MSIMAPRRKRVRSLGTFDVSVPAESSVPLVPLAPSVNTEYSQFPLNDPQFLVGQATAALDYPYGYSEYSTGYTLGYTSGYSPDLPPACPSNSPTHSHKRRRLEGFHSMPSVDEPSSSAVDCHEKTPVANSHDEQEGHDATSIIPRWAPAMPDVQTLSSPLACMAETMFACCNFAWQHPPGYQFLPNSAAVVYEPPQQYTMEVAPPPVPAQAIHPVQHLVSGTDVLPQHTPAQNQHLNLDALPLDSYPVLGEGSLQPLLQPVLQPILQEPTCIANTGDDPYLIDQTGHEYSNQLASSDLYNYPIVTAPIPMPLPLTDENPLDANTSLLPYGPAPLVPLVQPPLVVIEPTSPEIHNCYDTPAAQNLPQPVQPEDGGNTVGQRQDTNPDTLQPTQRSGKRGPFRDQSLREQTAQTRKMGSCIRCRMQRIRCEFNSDVPGGVCLTCKKVENTKAARLPCLRYKITDMMLYKPGAVPGYEWTQRWNKNNSEPIQLWAEREVKVIQISVHFSNSFLLLPVRKFVPQEGDKLERTWDYQGTKKSVAIPPYALVDLEAGKSAYTRYIRDSMTDIFRNFLGDTDSLLYKTYLQAWHMWKDPNISTESFELLNWTLRLWIAVRLSTTSCFIAGNERLGMSTDILDQTNPNPGKIPLPPVLGAQMDMILIQHIQSKLRHELLDNLQKVMLKNKPSNWLVTYLVTFILLHNIALITKHDAAYARKHGMKRRYAREEKVQEYHLGANIILAHFHYCNKGIVPFSEECEDQDLRTLAHLDEEKIKFVRATRAHIQRHKQDWEDMRARKAYEEDYFFVSQLFEEKWQPRTTVL